MADVATLVVKIVSDVKGATSGLDEVTSRSDKMKAGLGTAAKAATGVLLGLGAAAVVAGKAAADDAQGQALLANSLAKTTGANKDAIAGVEDFIGAMSLATGVADDQLRPAMASLATATGDVKTSQDALKVAMDVAAATGQDVETVSKAIAKGYGGQTTAIGRLVPGLDKATLASGDMAAVMDELKAKTGGSAAAAADTAAGKMARMTVSMDEAKEAIGTGLLPVMETFAGVMLKVGTFIGDNAKTVQILAVAIAAIAAAIITVNAVVSAWGAAVKIATAIQWLWNVAMTANPIGLIIVAVVALIAVIVLLWVKNDAFRAALIAAWDAIKTAVLAVLSAIKSAALAVWDAIKTGASAVSGAVSGAFDKIQSAVSGVFSWVKSNWPTLLAILTGPVGLAVLAIVKNWEAIESAFRTTVGAIKSVWNGAIGAIKDAVTGLGAILAAPFNTMKSAIDAVKTAIDTVVSAVGSLISKISNIHFPKIPNLPGLGRAAPAPEGLSAAALVGAPRVRVPVSRASTGGGVINISVTGAIDPEATARQIQRILAGHSRRVGLAS